MAPIVFTLIGQSGAGKSTLANMLVGQDNRFQESESIRSCTNQIDSESVPNTEIEVFDTPGLGDTDGRSEDFFTQITSHLYARGGVLAFVQSHGRVDQRVLGQLIALSQVLSDSLSTCCILVLTKWPRNRRHSQQQVEDRIRDYLVAFEERIRESTGLSFAKCYASDQQEGVLEVIKADLASGVVRSIQPGSVKLWSDIVQQVEAKERRSEEQKHKDLENQVKSLEHKIAGIENSIAWREKYLQPTVYGTSTVTGLLTNAATSGAEAGVVAGAAVANVPVVVAGAAVALGVIVCTEISMHNLRSELSTQERELDNARKALHAMDTSPSQQAAAQIRRYIE